MELLMTLKGVIGVIVVFSLLITFHELGHLIMALLLQMPVKEFSLGFGRAIWERTVEFRGSKLLLAVRWLPLGGYVRLVGEDPSEADSPDSFYNQPYWKRFLVIAAGPLSNYLFAFLIVAIAMSFLTIKPGAGVLRVVPNSPAERAGLKPRDIILEVNGKPVRNGDELIALVSDKAGKLIELKVRRGKEILRVKAVPEYDARLKRALLGIQLDLVIAKGKFNPLRGVLFAWNYVKEITVKYTEVLLNIRKNYKVISSSVRGPLGISQMIYQFTLEKSIYELVIFIAFLNIAIGYLNLLPFPALDGGRLLFLMIAFSWEKLLRRKWEPSKEELVHLIGFALLIILIILVTFKDIARLVAR